MTASTALDLLLYKRSEYLNYRFGSRGFRNYCGDEKIEIKMVLTTPFCPLAGFIVDNVKKKTREVAEGRKVNVVLLDEPWIPPDRLRGQRK